MKKPRPQKKRRSFLGMLVRGLLKCIAVLLAVIIFFGGICVCVTGSLALLDTVKTRSGQYYSKLQAKVEDVAKELILGEEVFEGDLEERLSQQVREMAQRQQETDALLLAELNSGAYSLDAPFVLVDPYGNSPLTAILLFETPQPSQISLHIAGDSKLAEVSYSFSGYETRHAIPVYGLYAQRENPVTITAKAEDGTVQTSEILVATDVLPAKLANDIVHAYVLDESQYQPGFNFTYVGNNSDECKSALDANGDYRWVLDMSGYGDLESMMGYCANYDDSDSVFIACGKRDYGAVVLMEINFMGKLLGAWYAPYGAHHDIMPTDAGTLLVTGSASKDTKEGLLYEIDMETGEIICALDYADVLQVYRDQTQDYPEITNFYSTYDWFHMNAIELWKDDLIVSGRHQSTVICNDRDGNIKWMLCDPTDYYEYYQQYILTPIGEDFEYSYIQHAPEVMPDQDGNPDTVDIILFDNGDFRGDMSKMVSRMVQYRIDEVNMTVEQIWSYGEDRSELWSYCHGDADLLENGNRLGSFEPYDHKAGTRCAYAIEVTEDEKAVWECWRMSDNGEHVYGEYRLERMDIYTNGANDLHLGEAARLFLPE